MEEHRKKYGLYVIAQEDIGEEEKHFLITPGYCLLYTSNQPPERSAEVTDMKLLPALARNWLSETIDEIRRRYLEENQAEILQRAKTFNDFFEKELQQERSRMQENGRMEADSDGR